MTTLQTLNAALQERRLLKVIAGIENFDLNSVVTIAKAAQAGGAQAVDIAADAALIKAVKEATNLIVFVSATEPAKLISAAANGAEVGFARAPFDTGYRDRSAAAVGANQAPLIRVQQGRIDGLLLRSDLRVARIANRDQCQRGECRCAPGAP